MFTCLKAFFVPYRHGIDKLRANALKKIAVEDLFGIFDHEVAMDRPEGVTIIHGPNGFGKTVMLEMVAATVQGDLDIFRSIPFREFSVEFDDGSSLRLVCVGTCDIR